MVKLRKPTDPPMLMERVAFADEVLEILAGTGDFGDRLDDIAAAAEKQADGQDVAHGSVSLGWWAAREAVAEAVGVARGVEGAAAGAGIAAALVRAEHAVALAELERVHGAVVTDGAARKHEEKHDAGQAHGPSLGAQPTRRKWTMDLRNIPTRRLCRP